MSQKNQKGNNMKKNIVLICITIFVLIVGISCASAASVSQTGHGASLKVKDYQGNVKISHASKVPVKKVATKKTAKKATVAKKSTKKTTKKAVVKKSTKKVAAKKTTKKATVTKKSTKKVNTVINGWNPKDHEVSRQKLGEGLTLIKYDDGYHRVVDSNGNILSYGY